MLTLRNVAKAFGEKTLFTKLNADVERNQRIFLLGANGTGKTTLLRMILGQEPADAGELRPGHNTILGYFAQNQLDTLDASLTVFDTMREACPMLTDTELRTLLGTFLFTGDQVFKPVSVLSGGEKSKLALAKLITSGPNTLLLDEPTNHMDIPAKEVMTDALMSFEGTMLCISHDRYFIQELATDIWELYEGQLIAYCGDYEYYLTKRDEMRAQVSIQQAAAAKPVETAKPVEAPSANASPLQQRKELEKQLKKVERQILTLEEEIAALDVQLNDPTLQQDYEKLQALSAQTGEKQQALSALNDEWAELAEALA